MLTCVRSKTFCGGGRGARLSAMSWRPSLRLCLCLVAAPAAAAAQAPDADYHTLHTPNFRITYESGLDALATRVAEIAELTRARYAEGLTAPPSGTVDVLLLDQTDFANGSAAPFPSNRITLLARPPVDNLSLAYFDEWIELVLVHELAHVFHLDQAGRLGGLLRGIFGRIPIGHPAFPALFTPGWAIEGLATDLESRYTDAGRVNGSYFDMVLRTAALRGALATIDRASFPNPVWPEGNHAYVYGAEFLRWVGTQTDGDATDALIEQTAHTTLSPTWFFDRIGRRAYDAPFTDLWRRWTAELSATATATADSLRALGLVEGERMTRAGRWTVFPRVSPDGRVVAYGAATGRDDPQTRLHPVGTDAEPVVLSRRSADGGEIGPASWLPDGSALILAQYEFDGPYRLFEDLYRLDLDGRETRLTRGARVTEPDVSPDGRTVIAVQNGAGTHALVRYDLPTGALDTLVAARPGIYWSLPRWSPDGRHIAVGRWSAGRFDIVVLAADGTLRTRLTDDRAVDREPTWSPDGRWVLFSSDRSGIPNLYVAPAEGGVLRQITNITTGAFQPDVAPDGRTLWFTAYDADGFHLHRLAFDPATWRAPAPLDARFAPTGDVAPPVTTPSVTRAGAAAPYSPWPTLRPYAWTPLVSDEDVRGFALGAATFGRDLAERHSWAAAADYAFDSARWEGVLTYTWAGLGNPVLGVAVQRDWDLDRFVRVQRDSTAPVTTARLIERADAVELTATLLRRRWRSSAALTLGVERIDGIRLLDRADGVTLREELRDLDRWGAHAQAFWSNARGHTFSISREEGVSALAVVRRRWDRADTGTTLDDEYTELLARGSGYRDLRGFGFADHVIAARVSGLHRSGDNAPLTSIGGSPDAGLDLGFTTVGSGHFLPVRGFSHGVRAGTRGWSASAEYRLPVRLVARGVSVRPVFLESLSAAVFIDGADIDCDLAQIERGRCRGSDVAPDADPLLSAGIGLHADIAAYFGSAFRLRLELATPLSGPGDTPKLHLAFGPSF